MHFFREGGVSAVLQSLCMTLYTAVLRAVLPCTHETMTIFRGALKSLMQNELLEEFYNSTTGVAIQCCRTQSIHSVQHKALEQSEIHACKAIHA